MRNIVAMDVLDEEDLPFYGPIAVFMGARPIIPKKTLAVHQPPPLQLLFGNSFAGNQTVQCLLQMPCGAARHRNIEI